MSVAPFVGLRADAELSEALASGTLPVPAELGFLVVPSSVTAAFIASRLPGVPVLVAEDAAHPYNLARRAASLHRLHGGRIGLLLGAGPDTQAAADAIRELWASWPESSLRLDKAAGVFAEIAGIRRVNTEGLFRIDGPLTVPLDAADPPLLAVERAAGVPAELVIEAAAASPSAAVAAHPTTQVVLARATVRTWSSAVAEIAALVAAGVARPRGAGSLRAALALPPVQLQVDPIRSTAYPALR